MNTTLLSIATQIVTQSLPISSSAHVALLHKALQYAGYTVPLINEATESLLHIPSLFVVCGALWYWYGALASRFMVALSVSSVCGQIMRRGLILTFGYLWLSTGITVGAYFLLKKGIIICPWSYAGGFAIMALLFISVSFREVGSSTATWRNAVVVGGAQALALCPGISRLGITYVAGRLLGWRPRRALTYSFLLELILMGGAVVRVFFKGGADYALLCAPVSLAVMGLSSIVAYGLIRGVMAAAQRYRLWWVSSYLAMLSLLI